MSVYGFTKDVLNAAACILLIACGILVICLTLLLPGKAPFPLTFHVHHFEIIIAGGILIFLAITPIVTVFNKGNLKWKVIKVWRNETVRELNGLLKESLPFTSEGGELFDGKPSPNTKFEPAKTSRPEVGNIEEVKYAKTETMIMCIDEPILEDDPNLSKVVDALEISQYGELSFPRAQASPVSTKKV